ncbi:MAG: hypothetical protein DHS20C03_27680 [Minwuia thermotolerans]|nr:MAG: hypothetical protein DHS20C03_27680 [Minwuia thermotolerans]
MARNRALGRSRGARRAPRVGIAAGGRRFDTPARVAFLHAANDNRPQGWRRLVMGIAVVSVVGLVLAGTFLAI